MNKNNKNLLRKVQKQMEKQSFKYIENYLGEATNLAHDAIECFIVTFGIWTGLTKKDDYTLNEAGNFLNFLANKNIPTQIIVGSPPYHSCLDRWEEEKNDYINESCEGCERIYDKWWDRYEVHVENWNEFNWIVKNNVHAKFMIFHTSKGLTSLVSSRNLSDSNWDEISFRIDDNEVGKKLLKKFIVMKATEITPGIGKHANTPLSKIEIDYLFWLNDNIYGLKPYVFEELTRRNLMKGD